MSCDLITETSPHVVLDPHRSLNPTMTAMLYDMTKTMTGSERSIPKDDESMEYIGMDPSSSQLLFTAAASDLDDDLPLRINLLHKFPRLSVSTQLRDAHLYVFKKWILELIVKNKSLSSIKLDLVPLLLDAQYRGDLQRREGIDKCRDFFSLSSWSNFCCLYLLTLMEWFNSAGFEYGSLSECVRAQLAWSSPWRSGLHSSCVPEWKHNQSQQSLCLRRG